MRFVLVHGTFSSNRTWEAFETELKEHDPSLKVSHWEWSGANAQGGRMEAARRLADHLDRQKNAAPEDALVVVGHSHGGNVCRGAASYAKLGSVQGIIYIATPHLLFAKKDGRATVYVLYALLSAMTTAVLATTLLLTVPAPAWLGAQIGGTIGAVFAYVACIAVQSALFLVLMSACIPCRIHRRRGARRLLRAILSHRRAAIRRNCFPPRRLPELSITTKMDEAYSYLRLMQRASSVYQWMIKAWFLVFSVMLAASTIAFSLVIVYSAVLMFQYVGEQVTTDTWEEMPDLLISVLSYLVTMPVLLFVMFLATMFLYLLFFGGAWSYGIRVIFDLFFLRLVTARSLPGQDTAVISFSFWQCLRQSTLMHFAIHRRPATARVALDWARTHLPSSEPLVV